MPRKRKTPQSAHSKRQKNFDFQEKKRKCMEVSSSPNESQPLQMECHVVSTDNNRSTRASLSLKKKREQSYEAYHKNPQDKRDKVKAHYWKNAATKRVASKLLARAKRALNPIAKKIENKAHYKKNCMKLKAVRKARYLLKEPIRIDSYRYLEKLKILFVLLNMK